MEALAHTLENFMRSQFVISAFWGVVIFCATALAAMFAGKLLTTALNSKPVHLPSSSIFVNLARAAIWFVGLSLIAATCFKMDVSGAITALGVGGVAVSFGFKDAFANIAGGLQVTLLRIIEPGDNIKVGLFQGVVKDVNWSNTTIIDGAGLEVLVPNLMFSTNAVTKLPPLTKIIIPFYICKDYDNLDALAQKIKTDCEKRILEITGSAADSKIIFLDNTDTGVKAKIVFEINNEDFVNEVTGACRQAIAAHAM